MERLSVRSFKQELYKISDINLDNVPDGYDVVDFYDEYREEFNVDDDNFISDMNLAEYCMIELRKERMRSWILSEYNDYMHGITRKNKNHITVLKKNVTQSYRIIGELRTQAKSMNQSFTKKDLYIKELEAKIEKLEFELHNILPSIGCV